jgi:Tol biopolymer transport system component
LYRVADTGGAAEPISTVDANSGESGHIATTFLPDGKQFLFLAVNRTADKTPVFVSSIDGGERTRIAGLTARAEYAAGYLWFIEGTALVARPFDPITLQLGDTTHSVADNVSDFAVAANGTLVTRPREQDILEMAWLDPTGKPQAVVGPSGTYRSETRAELAPDGRTLAFSRRDSSGNGDIWTLDLERNVASRLTSDRGDDEAPIYSPDGTWIAFASSRTGPRDLYRRAADGSGSDELLFASAVNKYPTGFTPDGASLLFFQVVPNTGADIWMLPLTGTRQAVPLRVNSALDGYATISPDGKWIAYCSGEPGEGDEVYVEPYPLTGSRIRLSTAGGQSPQWSASGREVYYGTPSGEIMRVPLTFSGGSVRPAIAQRVMKAPGLFSHAGFVLDRTSSRMLALATGPTTITAPLTVTLNWPALLSAPGTSSPPR